MTWLDALTTPEESGSRWLTTWPSLRNTTVPVGSRLSGETAAEKTNESPEATLALDKLSAVALRPREEPVT
jgi:hypothetical protein